MATVLGVTAVVVTAFGIGTWQQARLWRDSETLWRWGLEADPRCAVCANNFWPRCS